MEILRYRIHSRQRGCSLPPASGAGRGALPGPETGLLSDTRRWVEETHADKARDFIGKGTRVEGRRVREPRTALPRGLKFYGDGMSFRVVLGQSFWFRAFPGGAHIAQPSWMLARGLLGSGRTGGVSFRPFPNSSGLCWLISSIFLIRIACHKTAHANSYYGAWPGWAVSISVPPLTAAPERLHTQDASWESGGGLFLLLFLGVGLPSRAEASLYPIWAGVFHVWNQLHACNNSNLAWNCWRLSEMK